MTRRRRGQFPFPPPGSALQSAPLRPAEFPSPNSLPFLMNALLTLLAALVFSAAAHALEKQPVNAGPYVPSPKSVVSDMLTLAQVGPNDFVIDLGSGDGRIVLTAAKVFGARGFGVEIKDDLVRRSNEAARNE